MAYIASFLTAVPNLEEPDFVFTSTQKHASIGAIVMIYVSGFGWAIQEYRSRDVILVE
jgi:hypothetical protein